MLFRLAVKAAYLVLAISLPGQLAALAVALNSVPVAAGTLLVQGIGKGSAEIDGTWQFHLGDNLDWAKPTLDDSDWEPIRVDGPWGTQGHPSYSGFAWYRRHIEILPTAGASHEYRILIPRAEDAYEVYWNGVLIGQYGQLPPHPSWYYSVFPRSFALRGSAYGVLAIRVWKAPLEAFSSEESGGLYGPPLVADPDTISLLEQSTYSDWVRQDLFDYSLVLLRAFVTLLCLVLWIRNRREQLFLWVAVFTIAPVGLQMLGTLFLLPFSYGLARCLNQPLYVLDHISLWFLLVWLLQLNDRPTLLRWTKRLAFATFAAGLFDGLLALGWGKAEISMQITDGALTAFILIVEVFPFALIVLAFRRKLDPARWVVAISALIVQTIDTVAAASAFGQRFTHWTLFSDLIDTPLITIQGVQFRAEKITSILLFLAILYAVYRFALEQQGRRNLLEQEMQSAREIQQVLIPDKLPSLPGYAVTSAYHPALEVGGDFFQILANPDGSTIISLGDVSGKGLKAAMNVSMIVGVLRALADTSSSPAEILNGLNRCLCGRMDGGFTTGIVLRLDPNGKVTLANAGHLPPFLNTSEIELSGSLPMGLVSFASYDEITIDLNPGDYLSLFTDGLLEARNPAGELFGFERMHALLSTRPTAQQSIDAAVAFGQEDDITILTLTRLQAGQESSTSLIAPLLKSTSR